jgi:hypothetical protein
MLPYINCADILFHVLDDLCDLVMILHIKNPRERLPWHQKHPEVELSLAENDTSDLLKLLAESN